MYIPQTLTKEEYSKQNCLVYLTLRTLGRHLGDAFKILFLSVLGELLILMERYYGNVFKKRTGNVFQKP